MQSQRRTSKWLVITVAILTVSTHCSEQNQGTSRSAAGDRESEFDASTDDAAARDAAPAAARSEGNIVLDGTPEIPAALVERLRQYVNTRSAGLRSMTDDGSAVLVTTRFGQTAQLHLVSTPGGARRQLSFNDEPIRGAGFVPGSPRAVLYWSDVGGAEVYQIFRLDLDTGRTTRLTDGRSRHLGYLSSHDGSRIAYTNNARNGRDMDLYIADGRTAESESRLLEREGHWYPIDFSHDGRKLLIGHYVSINDSRIWEVDLETRELTRLTPEEPTASYRAALYSHDDSSIYVTTDREGEFIELYETTLEGEERQWSSLTRSIPWNIEEVALSHDGTTLALTANEDGYNVLRLLDTRTNELRDLPTALPRGLIGDIQFAREANVLGFSMSGATRTDDAYTLDLDTGELSRWTESEMGGLNPDSFIEPTLFRYETHDDREIPCFYYRPVGEGPFPVLVYIHGGPEGQAQPWFSALTQYLAVESGIAVLVPNVRGSDGYGKSYLLLDNGMRREDSVRDIGALLDWVEEQDELDDERMAVYGGSYGGYMVLSSLMHFGDRLVAGVDYVGISNFVTFLENTREYRRDLRRQEYGDERDPEMRRHLQSISPTNNVERIRSSLLVIHGANDPRVPLSEAEQLMSAVRANGNDVWYLMARNEGHGFRKKENRDLFYQLTILFLEQNLLRRED